MDTRDGHVAGGYRPRRLTRFRALIGDNARHGRRGEAFDYAEALVLQAEYAPVGNMMSQLFAPLEGQFRALAKS